MRKKYLVLLVFLVFLYIGPANLAPYDVSLPYVQEQQEAKKFMFATDYNTEIAADGDDCYWWYTGSWAIQKNDDHAYYLQEADENPIGWPVMRFEMVVPEGSTIDSANVSVWFQASGQVGNGEVYLIDEDDCGALEDDTIMPSIDTSDYGALTHSTGAHWVTTDITDVVQNYVDRGGYASGNYMGLMFQHNGTSTSSEIRLEDYEDPDPYHSYFNVSYSSDAGNHEPYTSVTPTCSNIDDTDNMYAELREYEIVVNVTDEDGFTDIQYVELSLWSDTRTIEYWRVRFDEDTATFSEQVDSSNMISLGTGANISSGNNLNITFDITVHWNHTDTTNVDANIYVRDDETQVQYFADDCKYFSVSANHYPHAYYYNHRTYVVWHGEGEEEDDTGNPFVRYYDHTSGFWSDVVQVGINELEDDFHGSPIVWVDNEGFIHIMFGSHTALTPLQHAKSNESESIEDGFTIENLAWNVTYPTVDYKDGITHMMYRWYDSISQFSWIYVNSSDNCDTWNTKHTFLDVDEGTGYAPYRYGPIGVCPVNEDRIHLSWSVYNETSPNEYQHVFHAYLRLDNMHVYSADDTDLGTTLTINEMLTYCWVVNTGSYHAASGSVHTDSSGYPYIMFASDYPSGTTYTYFTYWNGASWESPEAVCATNRYSSVADFIIHSSSNITAFITKVEDLHRYTWNGASWTDAETIMAATDSKDVSFGFVIGPYGDVPDDDVMITFCEWYNGYANKAWLWGLDGVLNDTSDDLGWYEVNFDVETRLDLSTYSLDDGVGTPDRGDWDSVASITASGTVVYYSSSLYPASNQVDVWIKCEEVSGSGWSDLTLSSGAFSVNVDSDDEIGLDTYYFRVVLEGEGIGGSNLLHATHSDTYIADRLIIDIQADNENPVNGQQVNFTLTVTYEYDSTNSTTYQIAISRNAVWWHSFTNSNKTLCNDTNSDVAYAYSTIALISETTHGITKYTTNSETVTWSAEGTPTATPTPTPTTTPTNGTGVYYVLYEWFFSAEVWSILGPMSLIFVGYFAAKKDRVLGIFWFVVECLFVDAYLDQVGTTPFFWWHILFLIVGGLGTCIFPLMDRKR